MSEFSDEPPEIISENSTIPEPSYEASLYHLRKVLFKAAMNREWKRVCELYKDEKVQGEYITSANDTLLHVAVSRATEKIILDLLDIVQRNKVLSYTLTNTDEIILIKAVKGEDSTNRSDTESPVLVAAKKGITEMVKRILSEYPVAIFDQDKDAKNIVLLAVEHRRVHMYDYMLSVSTMESVFWKLDKEGNSALHLDSCLWSTGAALHIQWEIKWYKYVRSSMGRERSATTNKTGKMPEEVFIESHGALIKDGITGLTNTCQSCSVVAALFATVAFQSVSTVPGGVDPQSGFPILSKRPVFQLFTISSLLALCFSVTSVGMFLAILISNFKRE